MSKDGGIGVEHSRNVKGVMRAYGKDWRELLFSFI